MRERTPSMHSHPLDDAARRGCPHHPWSSHRTPAVPANRRKFQGARLPTAACLGPLSGGGSCTWMGGHRRGRPSSWRGRAAVAAAGAWQVGTVEGAWQQSPDHAAAGGGCFPVACHADMLEDAHAPRLPAHCLPCCWPQPLRAYASTHACTHTHTHACIHTRARPPALPPPPRQGLWRSCWRCWWRRLTRACRPRSCPWTAWPSSWRPIRRGTSSSRRCGVQALQRHAATSRWAGGVGGEIQAGFGAQALACARHATAHSLRIYR